MKAVSSPSAVFTSMPFSCTATTLQVTVSPFLYFASVSIGSPPSCLMPSEMRSFGLSTSSTTALTLSPFL